jgi:alkylhydroperoxidase family enzyme
MSFAQRRSAQLSSPRCSGSPAELLRARFETGTSDGLAHDRRHARHQVDTVLYDIVRMYIATFLAHTERPYAAPLPK